MKTLMSILYLVLILFSNKPQIPTWKAPESANAIKSPIATTNESMAEGKNLFLTYCAVCHGNTGKGDGVAGAALQPKPGNFTKPIFKEQTDGAIYWKITTGRPPMAPYKGALEEDQIWKIIQYIKTL